MFTATQTIIGGIIVLAIIVAFVILIRKELQ
jgi:hypothetical protein